MISVFKQLPYTTSLLALSFLYLVYTGIFIMMAQQLDFYLPVTAYLLVIIVGLILGLSILLVYTKKLWVALIPLAVAFGWYGFATISKAYEETHQKLEYGATDISSLWVIVSDWLAIIFFVLFVPCVFYLSFKELKRAKSVSEGVINVNSAS